MLRLAVLVADLRPAGGRVYRKRVDPESLDPTRTPRNGPAGELAAGLAKKDLKVVEFTGASGADVDASFQPLVAGIGPLWPEVLGRFGSTVRTMARPPT